MAVGAVLSSLSSENKYTLINWYNHNAATKDRQHSNTIFVKNITFFKKLLIFSVEGSYSVGAHKCINDKDTALHCFLQSN